MFAASKSARSAAAGDNKFNYVTLLLNGDGTNGKQNNTFLDGSTNNFTITRNGTPTQGSFSPYGSLWSNYFGGSAQYLSLASNALLALGTSNFTMEMWLYSGANGTGTRLGGNGTGGSWAANRWVITTSSPSNANKFTFGVNNYGGDMLVSTSTFNNNQWMHVAISRSGNSWALWVNGTREAYIASSSISVDGGSSEALNIGRSGLSGDSDWAGYVSNFRLVKGTSVYDPTQTTLVVPLSPLTAITNTSLLTCQSNRFRDASSNNLTITANGTLSVQRFSPFEPSTSYTSAVNGGSGYFDGSSNWLSIPDSTALKMGSSDFTYECWLYPTSLANAYQTFIEKRASGTYAGVLLAAKSTGKFSILVASNSTTWGIVDETSVPVTVNQWQHLAVVRSGSSFYVYLNGNRLISTTISFSIYDDTSVQGIGVGSSAGDQQFSGYISDVRIVKGTALYTAASFTPPTAPLTAVANTSLLLNATNAGISDAAAINDITTVGDAQVSTTQVKYGTASMKFDGTGDYLTLIDNPNLQLMAGDFTIEGWIYLAANGVAYGIISKGTATTGWSVNVTLGNKLQFSYTLSNLTGATSLSASTWYHFAVVRSGTASGNLKVYLNGVADATSAGAVTDTFNQTSIAYVGADRIATSQLNGYIDDLRITKGHARYTATFTPPTAALPTF